MKLSRPSCIASLAFFGATIGYAATPASPPNLHHLMKDVIAVQIQVVWDLGNNALDDKGNPDASKLKASDWARIATASSLAKRAANTLAKADHILAAGADEKLEGEGDPSASSAKQVQGFLDADPKSFRAFAQALATSMDQITEATQTKDASKLAEVSGALDDVCETCHVKFWYPQQKIPR